MDITKFSFRTVGNVGRLSDELIKIAIGMVPFDTFIRNYECDIVYTHGMYAAKKASLSKCVMDYVLMCFTGKEVEVVLNAIVDNDVQCLIQPIDIYGPREPCQSCLKAFVDFLRKEMSGPDDLLFSNL